MINSRRLLLLAAAMVVVGFAAGQYDGPAPPRLAIPGAVPVRGGRGGQAGGGPLPARRPSPGVGSRGRLVGPGLRARPPAQPLPPRPVVELDEDSPSPTTFATPTYQPTTFQPPAFRPGPSIADLQVPTRQQYRGPPTEEAVFSRGPRPSSLPQEEESDDSGDEQTFTTRARPIASQEETGFTRSGEEQGFTRARPETQQYQRPLVRPAISQPQEQTQVYQRPRPKPQNSEENLVRRTEVKSGPNRAQLQARPQKPQYQQPQEAGPRQRKPVAQVIRKYRDDNPDGSITWGFENDDGTFKEETIGTDCVTRGKYGYIDPDGVKREYSYTSGIPCDKREEDSELGATNNEGYIDYSNNKYVLPNGKEIDLDNMVKNRARRPVYRN